MENPDKPLEFSLEDLKKLRALVRKHGREAVQARAAEIPLTKKAGRPAGGDASFREAILIHALLTQWTEEAEGATWPPERSEAENKIAKARLKKPVLDAYRRLYDVMVPADKQQPGHFDRWMKTMMRRRAAVSRLADEALPESLTGPKVGE
jgi:hypothetical protein